MKLRIVSPSSVIKDDNVALVSVETVDGSMSVLKGHVPFLGQLKASPLYYLSGNKKEYVAVMGGFVRVLSDEITIVSEDIANARDIDELIVKKQKEEAEAMLTKKAEVNDLIKAEIQLRRALVRLRVLEESKNI